MLRIDVKKKLGEFQLDANIDAGEGITVIFGPSGAGKTSLLRCIAGLETPQSGSIKIGERTLFDAQNDINIPTHQRRVGYVFQQANLFLHLNVQHNLTFSRWAGRPKASSQSVELDQVVELLGIDNLTKRMPYRLSGGERQRVSIARALLSDPALLLLDEPMSALDLARRNEIMPFLEKIRDEMKVPIVHVSHSVDEVERLADNLVLMQQGRVTDQGPIGEVLENANLLEIAAGRRAR